MKPSITIAGREIGAAHSPFVIAELSANHNGSLAHALELMEAAKDSGADAIKLQTYTADTMTIDHDGPEFSIKGGLWDGYTLHALYQEAHTPWEWHEELFAKGRELGLIVFSTPFDATALDFLHGLGAPAYKIASFELVDLPLIRKCAAIGKPMIMSTGMASLEEIDAAVKTAAEAGAEEIALLHCTSGYPTPPEEADLRTIPNLAEAFGRVTGLSDHTHGIGVAVAGIALGAAIVEKHFTLRRSDGGPDSAFSMEPGEFRALSDNIRLAWQALGRVRYDKSASEKGNVQFRRSLYIVEDIEAGGVLSETNLRAIRPGHGLAPEYFDLLLGKRINRAAKRGTPLSWDLIG